MHRQLQSTETQPPRNQAELQPYFRPSQRLRLKWKEKDRSKASTIQQQSVITRQSLQEKFRSYSERWAELLYRQFLLSYSEWECVEGESDGDLLWLPRL